jgi:hypothetical protein
VGLSTGKQNTSELVATPPPAALMFTRFRFAEHKHVWYDSWAFQGAYMPASNKSTAAAVPSNRAGLRDGQVSELTVIAPLKEGSGARLRAIFASQGGRFSATDKVGSVHDMRFVFLENDTKLLFASAYDGDWETYINDFATLIPEALDVVFKEVHGWPGIRSPEVKDFIVKYQITASAWYVAFPEATVPEIRRGQRIAAAVDGLLDAASR